MHPNNVQSPGKRFSSTFTVISKNAEETLSFGRLLGGLLQSRETVALVGELAAGKTWLAKGIAFGLGVPEDEYVTSPAFDLIHEYQGRVPVYHMDFYRLDELSAEDELWIQEYLDRDGVCIIEWANKFIDKLTDVYLEVTLTFGTGEDDREIRLRAVGDANNQTLERLREKCAS